MNSAERFTREMRRVGLDVSDITVSDNGVAGVAVDGWPDRVRYDLCSALPVLVLTADDAASTEDGDAALCKRLEAAGALLPAS